MADLIGPRGGRLRPAEPVKGEEGETKPEDGS